MKKTWFLLAAFLGLAIAGLANASAIKTWVTGETLTAADLNANFSHIHTTMVGGHGARLVNTDVSTAAAIAHSKLATPALVPKAFAYVATSCTTATCTVVVSSGITSITRTSAGVYVITWATARANANYAVLATVTVATAARCHPTSYTTTTVGLSCFDGASAAADGGFNILLMDDDN